MADTIRITSPKGIAQYPWLNKADTKFDDLGAYKVNLVVSKEDAEPFIKKVMAQFKEENPKGKLQNKPWTEELDDQGNATGNVILKFKNSNKQLRDGSVWDRKPALFDAKLKPTAEQVGAGSTLRISTDLYFWSVSGKTGVSLQIAGVQIIDLVERVSSDTSDFGFEPEEGYEGTNNEAEVLPSQGEDEDLF